MTTLWAFALALALLVVFHELGHFWVARRCGVKVLRFSIGFGKPLVKWHFGKARNRETEWVVSAIPLGGYVRMLDEREGEVAEHELHRSFSRQPVLWRMAIVAAGPTANLLLAIALYWALFMYGVQGVKPVLGEIVPDSPAAMAQFRSNEMLISINGDAAPSWEEVRWSVLNLALQGAEAHFEGRTEQGETLRHTLDLSVLEPADLDSDFMKKLGMQLFQPTVEPVIGKLAEGGVAQRSGLAVGDHIISVDARGIARWTELVEIVRAHPGKTLQFEIDRGGHLLTFDLAPEAITEAGTQIGKIGAGPHIDKALFDAQLVKVSYGPYAALERAVRKTWETAAVSLKMMVKMVFGEISLKNLSGPITIADYAGQSARMGVAAYLDFLALISVSLGVLNLLPIPLLDGGHLLYYMAELVKGSPVSERAWDIGQQVGIALLATLMAFALYNDISRLIWG
ncbi:MAG: regulator of sigma E protease [Gallionellaceae bacterium]|nr:MAG: regulator of sigma E protease [Gallionellaceae bacterium]